MSEHVMLSRSMSRPMSRTTARRSSRTSSRTMPPTISIVGAGRVGQTFAKRLLKLGWRIGAVVTRSRGSARAAVRSIGAGTPHAALTSEVLDADVLLLSVPDDVLENVAQKLARIGVAGFSKKTPGQIGLYTNGGLDHHAFGPLV